MNLGDVFFWKTPKNNSLVDGVAPISWAGPIPKAVREPVGPDEDYNPAPEVLCGAAFRYTVHDRKDAFFRGTNHDSSLYADNHFSFYPYCSSL